MAQRASEFVSGSHSYGISAQRGSVVMVVCLGTERSPVQYPPWALDVACCVLRQDTLSALSQYTQLKMGTGFGWGVNLRWTGVPSKGSL